MAAPDPLRIDFPGLERPDPDRRPAPDEVGRSGKKGFRPFRWLWRLVGFLALAGLALALPFLILVRISVFLFHRYDFGSWTALGLAALAAALLLVLYLVVASVRLGGKGRVPGFLWKGVLMVVAAYCCYALLFLSRANVKTGEVRATFTSLNPMLRVGVSTLLLVDRDAVLTDAARTAEDYSAWGLEVNEASLHLLQPDGFSYAVDLRTLGRPEWRNGLVEVYFQLMGFRTLRHAGTADHLHVSLAPNNRVRALMEESR
ncbi:hypothetical protein ACFL3S_08230 [Gemmatimonadota bacterium]